jgi:DNA repair exonuclease SbcCD ATPase subunit
MSFQTPEMVASRPALKSAAYVSQQQSPYPALNVDFGSVNFLPAKRTANFTPLESGLGQSTRATTAAPPVTFQFNDATQLADLLNPPSKHNLDHFHAGLLNHTDAINSLAQSIHSTGTALHTKLDQNNSFAHEVFDNHTGALNHLVNETQSLSTGVLNHKDVLNAHKLVIQQQTNEINELKLQLQSHHEKFHTGMANHTDVLRSHVGHIANLKTQASMYDTKFNEHADSISKTANSVRNLEYNSSRQSERINSNTDSISSVSNTLKDVHVGLVHHTDTLNSFGSKINQHATSLEQIKATHAKMGQRLETLEGKFNTGNAFSKTEIEQQIKDIKTAINSNAQLLDELLHERNVEGTDAMTRMMSSAPRR